MPAFFLLALGESEHAGTELRLSGDTMEIGKTYTISHGLRDVDARFYRPGVTVYPHMVPEGTLNIRSKDSDSVGGSFRFVTQNRGKDDKRTIDFYCINFEIKFGS